MAKGVDLQGLVYLEALVSFDVHTYGKIRLNRSRAI